MKSIFNSMKKEQILFPSIVIWAEDFKSVDDPYIVSFDPDETYASLAREFLGVELPEKQDDACLLHYTTRDGHSYSIATWDVFLSFAKPKQVRFVKRDVSEMNALAVYTSKHNS